MFKVAVGYDLYKSLGDIDRYRKFDIFKVKVSINSFDTMGFSARRDGRYLLYFRLNLFKGCSTLLLSNILRILISLRRFFSQIPYFSEHTHPLRCHGLLIPRQ